MSKNQIMPTEYSASMPSLSTALAVNTSTLGNPALSMLASSLVSVRFFPLWSALFHISSEPVLGVPSSNSEYRVHVTSSSLMSSVTSMLCMRPFTCSSVPYRAK